MEVQTVEQFLVEQLERIAPGKYALADVLQLFKSRLRFSCNHLKGGGRARSGYKDYNLSIFTFPSGVTEIKCLYNCGLKIRSDEKDLSRAFSQLRDLPTSNTKAQSEYRLPIADPGPVPVYTDAYRRSIKESNDMFWESITQGLLNGRIKPSDPILGAVLPHPDPVEAPDSIVERGIRNDFLRSKRKSSAKAQVVVQDSVPALKPVKKIRKTRKTQSRKRGK